MQKTNKRIPRVAAGSLICLCAGIAILLAGIIFGKNIGRQITNYLLNGKMPASLAACVIGLAVILISLSVYRQNERNSKVLRKIVRYRWLYIMVIPAAAYYLIFKFLPVLNLRIVLQNYSPTKARNDRVEWLSPIYYNFLKFFTYKDFWMLLRNTLTLAILNVIFYFPFPIVLALLLNEVRMMKYKRTVQSILYLPHFVSWTVLGSIMLMLLGPSPNGLINSLINAAGGNEIRFMMSNEWFRPMYILEIIWKEAGWGTIIYLAALSGVDEQLYEASVIDGAGRFKQLLYITLPSIRPTIVIMLILRMGNFLDSGFDQIYLMLNAYNREVATVFDTYVYDVGLVGSLNSPAGTTNYSYSATVGVFRSVVALALVLSANYLAKKSGEEGIY